MMCCCDVGWVINKWIWVWRYCCPSDTHHILTATGTSVWTRFRSSPRSTEASPALLPDSELLTYSVLLLWARWRRPSARVSWRPPLLCPSAAAALRLSRLAAERGVQQRVCAPTGPEEKHTRRHKHKNAQYWVILQWFHPYCFKFTLIRINSLWWRYIQLNVQLWMWDNGSMRSRRCC